MNKKNKIIVLFFIVAIPYLYCVATFIMNDIYPLTLERILQKWTTIMPHLLPRLFLYMVDYFTGILLFISCLLYAEKRKKLFYILSIINVVFLLVSIHFNLPLYARETSTYNEIWQTDVIEYFYPALHFILLLCILFFPAVFDFIKKHGRGKKVILCTMGVVVVAPDIIMLLDSYLTFPFLLIKGILLYLIYKMTVYSSEIKEEVLEKKSYLFLKLIIPLIFIVFLFVSTVKIKGNCLIIPQAEQIDGYWFIGGVNAFIENYENPYQEKRCYLDIEYVKHETVSEKWKEYYTWRWYYDEQEEKRYLIVYGRRAEALYYLELFEKEEYERSLHQIDLSELSDIGSGKDGGYRTYRAVLSAEETENTVYYYEIKSDIPYSPDTRIYGFLGNADIQPRALEEYDIAIKGKEIPAYFLGMVKYFGVVKVEPYTHYRNENYFDSRKNGNHDRLNTQRQY